MARYSPGIRDKLIGIFVLIKVLPLIVLAWFAWDQIFILADTVERHVARMVSKSTKVVKETGDLSTKDSIRPDCRWMTTG